MKVYDDDNEYSAPLKSIYKGEDCPVADTRIILAGLWTALMLTYLLGDVLRIFAGDFDLAKFLGSAPSQIVWLGIAVIMLLPILMIVLTLTLPHPAVRLLNIIMAVFLVIFNLIGLPYQGMYDNFLIIVSFGFNALTIWYAWQWT